MKRDPIDLHYVMPEHIAVHTRLVNWGKWSNPRSAGSQIQPCFRGYEPYAVPRDASGASEVDPLDAQAVQKIMHRLPRVFSLSLAWCYVHPYIAAGKMCRRLGMPMRELGETLHNARSAANNVLRTV